MTVLILASGSTIRAALLRGAEVEVEVRPARVDEDAVRESMQADGASPRDIADALAEHKARKAAMRDPQALVLGCDQILDCGGTLFTKPADPEHAIRQLKTLRGRKHHLYTAAVLYAQGQPVWRHVSVSQLTMREVSDAYINGYVARHWSDIQHCVGCYQIEGPGIRLFAEIDGDLFAIQGLPLLEILSILTQRGDIDR